MAKGSQSNGKAESLTDNNQPYYAKKRRGNFSQKSPGLAEHSKEEKIKSNPTSPLPEVTNLTLNHITQIMHDNETVI